MFGHVLIKNDRPNYLVCYFHLTPCFSNKENYTSPSFSVNSTLLHFKDYFLYLYVLFSYF